MTQPDAPATPPPAGRVTSAPATNAAVIRPVAPPDRDAWRRLFAAYGEFYETAFDESVLDGVWAWLLDAEHPVTALVAELDAQVVGFAHLRRQHDTFTAGPGWFLDDLYVLPAQRGAGVARALIEGCAATAQAGGGGTLRWITASDNHTAQRLYDRLATRTSWVTYGRET
ncbi:GNAT family N-acetyltransferase [Lysinimonas soli]|uniref:GNAT family N-acetyltransferase n=1 Tax=Lysinimonas soli TaxID=1074233 RepID=A0ABW0NPH4_9MICO